MSIETLLRDEVRNELDELKDMEKGSEEYKATVDGITKLVDRVIEIEKLAIDSQDKEDHRDEDRRDRIIKNFIAVAGIVVPSALTIWGTLKSFEFEEKGAVTTIMGRGFINKLLPKK